MSAQASQTQTGTDGHVGLVARACTNTSTNASQTQARMQHKPPSWRLPGGLRVLSSGMLGGSLFCSWTCPEQGSHTAVLDGSLFEEAQGGHTFWARTTWSGNTRGLKPEPTPPQTQHGAPFACDGAHVVPQRCVQAGRAAPMHSPLNFEIVHELSSFDKAFVFFTKISNQKAF